MKKRIASFVLTACLAASLVPYAGATSYTQYDYSAKAVACRVKQQGVYTGDCGIASMASVEAYVNGLTGNSQEAYNAVYEKNGNTSYCYWSRCGYASYTASSSTFGGDMQKFYLAVYNQLAKGVPCIVRRADPSHYSLVVGYIGTSSTFSPEDFLMVDVIATYSDAKSLMTMKEWLSKSTGNEPAQLVVRTTGVGKIGTGESSTPSPAPSVAPTPSPSTTPTPSPSVAPAPTPSVSPAYKLTFDPNGGTVSQTSKTVTLGKAVGSLPAPTRSGYTFSGWYNEAEEMYLTKNTIYALEGNSNLTAIWVKDPNAPSEWAEEEVNEAIEEGLVPAAFQSQYDAQITREEFCQLIVNMIERVQGVSIDTVLKKKGISIDTKTFSDTKDKKVLAANALGIVEGFGGKFNPDGKITRQEAATMLVRTCYGNDLSGIRVPDPGYADKALIADWALQNVKLVSHMKDPTTGFAVMRGGDGNKFDPEGTYTREQAYMTILRVYHHSVA
ncbi:MAG: InlB B-repeat-containing protein [Oscillospiraceae bacterium]|jgi:uncharacterized repeat protein (TIGR02543 family)